MNPYLENPQLWSAVHNRLIVAIADNLVDHLSEKYRILICRGDQRPNGELYAFSLCQPIPAVTIPLLPGEAEPSLNLQSLLNRVYERGRYHLAIDYQQPPSPLLSSEDNSWLDQQLCNCATAVCDRSCIC
jgi:hypothetical protein